MIDQPERFAIIGLGNPGREYEDTRHNVGFMAIDRISRAWDIPVNQYRFKSLVGKGLFEGRPVILAKPQQFMNRSGEAVTTITRFYKLPMQQFCIIHDDLDLPFGNIRMRISGGSAGQKGMESIITKLGTDVFYRLRIGIGRPPGRLDAVEYVLQPFRKADFDLLETVLQRTVSAIELLIREGIEKAMTFYNRTDDNQA